MAKWRIYNNGTECRRFNFDETIPEGWVPGYTEEKRKQIAERKRKTNLEKYGVDSYAKSEKAKKKTKQHFIEKYGVDNPFKSDIVKEKIRKTNIERYNTEYPTQSEYIKEKTKQTCLEKYNTEYAFQSEEVKAKIRETMLDTYGVEHALQSEEILNFMKENNIKKYGVENVSQSKSIQEKIKRNNIEKYGVSNPMQVDSIKEKVKQTNIERYGVECTLQSEGSIKKKTETWLENYGVNHPSKSEEIKQKKIKTCLHNYGVEYPMQSEEVKNKSKQTNLEKYDTEYFTQTDEYKNKTKQTNLERYGVPWTCMRDEARLGYSNDSSCNRKFAEILDSRGIPYQREFNLENYSYDFKVGNILIEINPTATHNTQWSPFGNHKGIDKNYHLVKSQVANNHGYSCIHIFDWDNKEKIANRLMQVNLDDSNLVISEVPKRDVEQFNINNNISSVLIPKSSQAIGLYENNVLISMLNFYKPGVDNVYVLGIVSQVPLKDEVYKLLFSRFVGITSPRKVITKVDKAKFSGSVYKYLGFNKEFTLKPGAISYGNSPVYDCGYDIYTWEKR